MKNFTFFQILIALIASNQCLASTITSCGEITSRIGVRSVSNVTIPLQINERTITAHFKTATYDSAGKIAYAEGTSDLSNLDILPGVSLIPQQYLAQMPSEVGQFSFSVDGTIQVSGFKLKFSDNAAKRIPHIFAGFWNSDVKWLFNSDYQNIILSSDGKKVCSNLNLDNDLFSLANNEIEKFQLISFESNDWSRDPHADESKIDNLRRDAIANIFVSIPRENEKVFAIEKAADGGILVAPFSIPVSNCRVDRIQPDKIKDGDDNEVIYPTLSYYGFDTAVQGSYFGKLLYKYQHKKFDYPAHFDCVMTNDGIELGQLILNP